MISAGTLWVTEPEGPGQGATRPWGGALRHPEADAGGYSGTSDRMLGQTGGGASQDEGRPPHDEDHQGGNHQKPGQGRWRGSRFLTVMIVVVVALTGGTVLSGTLMVQSRLADVHQGAEGVTDAWAETHDRMAVVRQMEAARALVRQVRFAPTGDPGVVARRDALAHLTALLRDPVLEAAIAPGDRDALAAAVTDVGQLAALRARPGLTEGAAIRRRLDALAAYAEAADHTHDGAWGRSIQALYTVLEQAASAGTPAQSFFDHEARRLADQVLAVSPPRRVEAGGGTVGAVVERALSIPALRAAELAIAAESRLLWQRTDRSLARLGDHLLAEAEAHVRSAVDQRTQALESLSDGLLALGLGAVSVIVLGAVLLWTGAIGPLIRLGRWAVELDGAGAYGASGGARSIAQALATIDAVRHQAEQAEAEASQSRSDAAVLRAALLGAAPEAALGRSLTTVAQELQTLLGDIRAHATLARHECDCLVLTEPVPPRTRMPRPLPPQQDRAARLILDACAALRDQCEFAAHLVGALRTLAGADDSQRHSIDLSRILEETLAVVAPRLRMCGATVRLSCNESVVVRGDPVALGAVVFYVVESAFLRSEDAAAATRDRSADQVSRDETVDEDDSSDGLGVQGRLALGDLMDDSDIHPHGDTLSRLNGVSVETMLESGGRVRVTIADDGPAPGEAVQELLRTLDPSQSDRSERGLAPALRESPDAAALVLADALARTGLGCGLDILAGEDCGLTVRLYLPLLAAEDDR